MPRVLETALYATDLDAAERFYVGVVGLSRVMREGSRHLFLRAEGSMVLIFNPLETPIPAPPDALPVPPHGAHGPGHVAFDAGTRGIEGWRARLAAMGVPVEARVDWSNGAVSIYVGDPAGNSVEFAERRLWGFGPED